jgi:hypothetical protein
MATAFIESFRPQPIRRVRVNLNAITTGGSIRVRASHADGPVKAGQLVQIFEPSDEIEGIAKVLSVNLATGLMYLDVQWDTLHDLPAPLESHAVQLGVSPVKDRPFRGWLGSYVAVAW